jgi:hypothetical protein
MTKRKTSMLLSALTTGQIAHLANQTGLNQSEVIAMAIDRMYQQERTMTTDYGTVTHEGTTYTLTQQAYPSGRVFTGWWGDASEGEEYTAEYEAHAVDAKGDEYIVRWHFDAVRNEEPEDEGNWPWFDDNIVAVIPA